MQGAVGHIPAVSDPSKNVKLWGWILVVLSLILVGFGGPSGTIVSTLGSISCCGALILLSMGYFGGSKKPAQVMYVQTVAAPQQVRPVQHQPQFVSSVAAPNNAESMKSQFQQEKRLEHLKVAQQRELARDYEAAVIEYEAAQEFSEAGRVRQLMKNMGHTTQAPVQVNIGQVGNSTVSDSVIMPQQTPSPQTQPVSSTCRHCGEALSTGWQFCPACNNPVS